MSGHIGNRGRPVSVSNAKKDDLQYTDVSFAAIWDANDQPAMDAMFHNKIRFLNKKFNELRYKEMRLYLKNFRRGIASPVSSKGRIDNIHDIPGMQKIWEQKAEFHQIRWELIEGFEELIKRKWNDQTPRFPYQPQGTAKQEDLVTNYGMQRFAALICNESNTYFNQIGAGSSLIPAGIGQIELFDEKARTSVDENGWMTAKGRLIRGGAEFAKIIPSFTCSESAILDHSTAGGCGWRTVYPSAKVVAHVKDETYLTISHTVDQGSVGL